MKGFTPLETYMRTRSNSRDVSASLTGFTLIETMVAITILTFAMAGPLFTAHRSIVAAQTARDQLTAMYLAQEGIEYVRAMRDNVYLAAYAAGGSGVSSTAWSDFFDNQALGKCLESEVCTLDPVPEHGRTLSRCPNGNCDWLSLTDGDSPIYTQQHRSGNTQSPFTRTIQGISISPNEVKIVSTVSWSYHDVPYSVTVSDHLTAWH